MIETRNTQNKKEESCDNVAFESTESSMTESEMDAVFLKAMAKHCPTQYRLWKDGYELKKVWP